jgi:hypothetical protein
MNTHIRAYFGQKKIPEGNCPKIYLGKDPDPVKNRLDPQLWVQ